MGVIEKVRARLRRRPVDPERALQRAEADARRRAVREQGGGATYGGGGGWGEGGAGGL